ncbi:hypothetical protein ACFLTH_06630 [Bacteroidota bacterium]
MTRIFLILYFIFIRSLLSGQVVDSLHSNLIDPIRVDSIKIVGNDITQDFVIFEELTFNIGDEINLEVLEFNKERLYSLRIFTFVDIFVESENNINIVTIKINEAWYIYPWPFIRLNHSSFKYASYGFYFRWKNFRGRNESIRVTVSLGYDPYYKIDYYNPYLLKNAGIYFSFHSAYQKFANKSKNLANLYGHDLNYKIFSNYVSLGKRIDKFNYLSTLFGFNYIQTDEPAIGGATASNTRIDRTPFVMLSYIYDSRDLVQFPQYGFYGRMALMHKGFNVNNIDYNILAIEFRKYWNFFDDFVLRGRGVFRKVFGPAIPLYDYSYLGYSEFVRGHSRDVREGHNYIVSSIELSYPIFKEWNFSLDLPLISERITSARIGMYAYLFADTGMTFMNDDKLLLRDLYSGYGIGINILFLPYSGIRIEYALDENKNGELIIGTDYSF